MKTKIILILMCLISISCSYDKNILKTNSYVLFSDFSDNKHFIMNMNNKAKENIELPAFNIDFEQKDLILDYNANTIYIIGITNNSKTIIYDYNYRHKLLTKQYSFDEKFSDIQVTNNNLYCANKDKVYRIEKKSEEKTLIYETKNEMYSFTMFENLNILITTEYCEVPRYKVESSKVYYDSTQMNKIYKHNLNTGDSVLIDDFSWLTTSSLDNNILYLKDYDIDLDEQYLIKKYNLSTETYTTLTVKHFMKNYILNESYALIVVERNKFFNNLELIYSGTWDTRYLLYNLKTNKHMKILDSDNLSYRVSSVSL